MMDCARDAEGVADRRGKDSGQRAAGSRQRAKGKAQSVKRHPPSAMPYALSALRHAPGVSWQFGEDRTAIELLSRGFLDSRLNNSKTQ